MRIKKKEEQVFVMQITIDVVIVFGCVKVNSPNKKAIKSIIQRIRK